MTDTAGHPAAALDGRTRRGEATRERLLIAAIRLFGSQGFESTSMKELAAAAGVRAPAIYNTSSPRKASSRPPRSGRWRTSTPR